LKAETYKKIFSSDLGSLLEIRVFNTSVDDWQVLLDDLVAKYVSVYSEDGIEAPLPSAVVLLQRDKEKALSLEVLLCGFTMNCHFFDDSQIQLNISPEDVDSIEKAEAVFDFMKRLSTLLNKQVTLTPEYGGASLEEVSNLAVCVADPTADSVHSRLDNVGDKPADN
jgi:hypothetical protein